MQVPNPIDNNMTERTSSPDLTGTVPERVAFLETIPASQLSARNDDPEMAENVIAGQGPLGSSIPHHGAAKTSVQESSGPKFEETGSSHAEHETNILASSNNTHPVSPQQSSMPFDTFRQELQTTREVGRETIENISSNVAPIVSNVVSSAKGMADSAVESAKQAAQGVLESGQSVLQGAVNLGSQGAQVASNVAGSAIATGHSVLQGAMNLGTRGAEAVAQPGQAAMETAAQTGQRAMEMGRQTAEAVAQTGQEGVEMGRRGAEMVGQKVEQVGQKAMEIGPQGAETTARTGQEAAKKGRQGAATVSSAAKEGGQLAQGSSKMQPGLDQESVGAMAGEMLEDINVKVGSAIVPEGSEEAAAQLKKFALVEHDVRTTTFSEPQPSAEGSVIVTTTVSQKRAGLVDQPSEE